MQFRGQGQGQLNSNHEYRFLFILICFTHLISYISWCLLVISSWCRFNGKQDGKVEAAKVKFQADTFETKGRANGLSDKKKTKLEWIKYAAPLANQHSNSTFLKVGPKQNPFEAYVCVEDGQSRSSAHCRVVKIVWSGPSYWFLWASLEKRVTPTNQNEEPDTTLYCAELLL